jgi:hypothetical protein
MTTQYTPTLKLALPVTGELSGTWGDVVNDNITSMIEQAIAGLSTINTWTANAHTLTTANGTTSESRCAMLVAATGAGGTALTGAGEIICPAAAKLYVMQNTTAFVVTLKTSAGTGVAVAAGNTAFLFCDGTNVNSCVTTIVDGNITGNLTVGGNATINGNTTLGNATTDTITATARFNTDLLPSTDNARDLGSVANSWKDLYIDGTAYLALVDINGGTIDGVSIGATTAATLINVDNLRLDGNTLSSTDTNGNVVIAPNGTGDVQLDADTVRVGDSGAAATLTSNGAGALTVTTGGAADLTLSTNSGTTSGTITIANGANGNITLTPDGTGDVILSADRVQIGDSNTDTTLTTNGTGNLNLTTNNGTNSGTIQIAQGVNGNITLTPNGTGSVSISKLYSSGNTTLGATSANTLSVAATITSNLIFTDNTYDIGASGATRPRNLYLAGDATIGGSIVATTLDLTNLEVTNIKAKDGTAAMTIADSTGAVAVSTNMTIGNATSDTLTVTSTVTSNLIFTDNTYDIGASGATRPRNLYLAGLLTMGGALTVNGNTTLGDAAGDTLTINGTAVSIPNSLNFDSNTLFIDATNNRVGVLTNAPDYELSVVGSVSLGSVGANLGVIITPITSTALPSSSVKSIITGLNSGFGYAAGSLYIQPRTGVGAVLVLGTEGVERVKIGNSEAIFNDPGNDVDFRVESDNNTHMFFVDASTDRIGINDSTPSYQMDFGGGTTVSRRIQLQRGSDDANQNMLLGWSGIDVTRTSNVIADAQSTFSINQVASNATRNVLYVNTDGGIILNEDGYDSDFRVESDNRTHMLFVDAGTDQVIMGQSTPRANATLTLSYSGASSGNNAQLSIDANANSGTGQAVMELLAGSGSTNRASRINFLNGVASTTTPRWTLINDYDQNGTNELRLINAATYSMMEFTQSGGVVFNEGSNDLDFRVESDGTTHMLFVDAGNNRVGVGLSSPGSTFHVGGTTSDNITAAAAIAKITGTGLDGLGFGTFASSPFPSWIQSGYMGNGYSPEFNGGYALLLNPAGSAGVGVRRTSASYPLHVGGSAAIEDASAPVLYFIDTGNSTSEMGVSGSGAGLDNVYIAGYNARTTSTYDFRITGANGNINTRANLSVGGALSKASGSFRIDHPLPSLNETHHLVHSFVEAPQADLYYRGKVALVNGRATVNIDQVAGMTEGTFVLLNREVQCFTSNETDWDAVRGSVSGNILTIECQNQSSTATVSWMVVGERKDKHMYDTDWTDVNGKVIVEPLKPAPEPTTR